MKPEAWLKRAIGKRGTPEPLQQIVQIGNGTVASDGIRVHYYDGDLGFPKAVTYPDLTTLWPKQFELVVKISTGHLLQAAKVMEAMGKSGEAKHQALRMDFRREALHLLLENEAGRAQAVLTPDAWWFLGPKNEPTPLDYHCEGGSGTVYIQPKFLKEAIWGMARSITIFVSLGTKRMVITSPAGEGGFPQSCKALICCLDM